ncbi:MAG: hypothetical protein H6648_08725 [Caldilineae bacterium]|nr:hypothetical protein [Caldilineae bacterium]
MPKIVLSRKANRNAAPWTLYVAKLEDGERSAPLPKSRYAFVPDEPVELSDAEARFFLDRANVGGRVFERVKEASPPAPSTPARSALGGDKPDTDDKR